MFFSVYFRGFFGGGSGFAARKNVSVTLHLTSLHQVVSAGRILEAARKGMTEEAASKVSAGSRCLRAMDVEAVMSSGSKWSVR